MAKIKLLIFLVSFLPAVVYAQGDDFPGGGFPSYPPGTITNFPVNGGQWQWGGTKWGPVQVPALRGDTIVFDVVGNCRNCYWRFAIEYASPMISAGTEMQLTGDYNRWHHWLDNGYDVTFCVGRCEFRVKAGEDYPLLWLAFDGNSDWYNEIQIKEIIPAPLQLFTVLTPEVKDAAQRIGGSLSNLGGTFANVGQMFGYPSIINAPALLMAYLSYGSWRFADLAYDVALDPPDGDYCTPVDEYVPDQQAANDLDWVREGGYDWPAGGWTIAAIEVGVSYGNMAYTALNRAQTAADNGAIECASARRQEAIAYLHEVGNTLTWFRWGMATNADAYRNDFDMSEIDNNVTAIDEAAGFFQSLQ